MDTRYPEIDTKSLLTVSEYALAKIPKLALHDFCSTNKLVVDCSAKRGQLPVKKDYILAIQGYKRCLQDAQEADKAPISVLGKRRNNNHWEPREDESSLVAENEANRTTKYAPRKRQKTQKALAAETQTGRYLTKSGPKQWSGMQNTIVTESVSKQLPDGMIQATESKPRKRSGDDLMSTTTKRLKTLGLVGGEITGSDSVKTVQPKDGKVKTPRLVISIPPQVNASYTSLTDGGPAVPSARRPNALAFGEHVIQFDINTSNEALEAMQSDNSHANVAKKLLIPPNAQKTSTYANKQQSVALPIIKVNVRVYRHATDMDHVIQAQVCRGPRGEIDLNKVREQLVLTKDCLPIDPTNKKPLYLYNDNVLESCDVDDLMEGQDYIRIVCDNAGM